MLPDHQGVFYIEVLKELHTRLSPERYLEIGTLYGESLAPVRCNSLAIDPQFQIDFGRYGKELFQKPSLHLMQMESDAFFGKYKAEQILGGSIDLAFLDGMHLCEFLLRDFMNAESNSHRDGILVLHDCLPVEANIALRKYLPELISTERKGWWTGDVWRAALLLKRVRKDLRIISLDSWPTGLILVTNLNPNDQTLKSGYDDHVAKMLSWDLETIGIEPLFAELEVKSVAAVFEDGGVQKLLGRQN